MNLFRSAEVFQPHLRSQSQEKKRFLEFLLKKASLKEPAGQWVRGRLREPGWLLLGLAQPPIGHVILGLL